MRRQALLLPTLLTVAAAGLAAPPSAAIADAPGVQVAPPIHTMAPVGGPGPGIILPPVHLPIPVVNPTPTTNRMLAGGWDHTLYASPDGSVWSWGSDAQGQLGTGAALADSLVPVRLAGICDAQAVAAGDYHSLLLRGDGSVWSWGLDDFGQLGIGSRASQSAPVQVPGLSNVVAIAAGGRDSLAIRRDGSVWAWGAGGFGQLGDGGVADSLSPVQVGAIAGAVAVSTSGYHALAALGDGSVWSWGNNGSGELGLPTAASFTDVPTQVEGVTGAVSVAAGANRSLALLNKGVIETWGAPYLPDLSAVGAQPTPQPFATSLPNESRLGWWAPRPLAGIDGVTSISAGVFHAIARRTDGTVWTVGGNSDGQLGTGSTSASATPTQLSWPAGVSAVAAGQYFSLALTSASALYAWGDNGGGQLGTGDRATRVTPTGVTGAGAAGNQLRYLGGLGGVGVQTAPSVYLVLWDWNGVDPAGESPYLQSFLNGVLGSSWNTTVTQYCQGVPNGSITCDPGCGAVFGGNPHSPLAGVWADNANLVPASPTQNDLAGEATLAAAHFGNLTPASNVNTQYVIATPTGHSTAGFMTSFCAWHTYTVTSYGNLAFTNLPYLPDAGATCGAGYVNGGAGPLDAVSIVEGHELAETETDPMIYAGWMDGGYEEIGDKCAWISDGPGAARNVSLSTGSFPVQTLWSNAANAGAGGCAISYP
ncbi:MAG TPA: hypothetical protein VG245_11200 [Candidatus Dormibacteraeota bacterium]|jgi:serine protease|nr:hypothetical protein [Candidatus Dormibacteraeota bacterium]